MSDVPHTLVSHPAPLTGERSVEAWTYIDLSYGSGWEKLFVAPAGPHAWRVCNIPHHVYGLKVVSVVTVDPSGRISDVILTPEAPAYRLVLRRPSDRDVAMTVMSGGWVEPMFTSFIGVQAHSGHDAEAFDARVQDLIDMGIVVDAEDVMSSAFDPGPASIAHAAPDYGPGVYEPERGSATVVYGARVLEGIR